MEQEPRDAARDLVLRAERLQLGDDGLAGFFARRGLQLDAQHRFGGIAAGHAHEGGARHARAGVEDALAGNGEARPLVREDAVRLAAAEPEPTLRVEVAEVAHAMPEALAVLDLRQRG